MVIRVSGSCYVMQWGILIWKKRGGIGIGDFSGICREYVVMVFLGNVVLTDGGDSFPMSGIMKVIGTSGRGESTSSVTLYHYYFFCYVTLCEGKEKIVFFVCLKCCFATRFCRQIRHNIFSYRVVSLPLGG